MSACARIRYAFASSSTFMPYLLIAVHFVGFEILCISACALYGIPILRQFPPSIHKRLGNSARAAAKAVAAACDERVYIVKMIFVEAFYWHEIFNVSNFSALSATDEN